MNNAKKIMKNQGKPTTNKKQSSGKWNKAKVLFVGGIALCVVLIIALCYGEFRPRVIATVGDKKIYLTDAVYNIYTTEAQYKMMERVYTQMYGTDYWSMEVDDEGTTGAEQASIDIMAAVQKREVLAQEAAKGGITLTEEEKKTLAEQAKSIRANLTDEQRKIKGLEESKIFEILQEELLADKYKRDMQSTYEINKEEITKEITKNEKDYRQYDLQYYYVSTQTTDANGNTVEKSDAEKESLRTAMLGHYEQAKTAKDFTKLVGEDEKNGIQYLTEGLVEKDTDFLTEDIRKKLKKLKNGELSEFVETETGYYFFRMENNNSSEAFEKAKEDAVEAEKDRIFDEEDYFAIASPYGIEENLKEWEKVEIGSYTI